MPRLDCKKHRRFNRTLLCFFLLFSRFGFGTTREQVNHKHIKLEKGIRETHKMPNHIGGGGEDRTPDLGVMNPETMYLRSVGRFELNEINQ